MYSFKKDQSIKDFQKFTEDVYGQADGRLFSIDGLLSNQERFTMRALKGIRKGDSEKLRYNLLIALSWLPAVANRLYVDLEEHVWQRFPGVCSYCACVPCACKTKKPSQRLSLKADKSLRPRSLAAFQDMFRKIYPPESRNLEHAGIHMAEEMGEVSEAIHAFMGEHRDKQFNDVTDELADYFSCMAGVANSADIDMAAGLSELFSDNCHVCHKAPCECTYAYIVGFNS